MNEQKRDKQKWDEQKKHAPLNLGDVLVLGLGKSGRAVCDYCVNLLGTRVASLTIAAGAKAILYGDYSGLSTNIREDISIEVLREKYATQHAIGVVSWFEFDSKVTDNQKLAVLTMKEV